MRPPVSGTGEAIATSWRPPSDWVLEFWSATTGGPLGSGDGFYLYSSWLQRCVYEMSAPSPVDEPAANLAVVCWK